MAQGSTGSPHGRGPDDTSTLSRLCAESWASPTPGRRQAAARKACKTLAFTPHGWV
jgi:hypothetical protein